MGLALGFASAPIWGCAPDILPGSYLSETTLVGIETEVVELGPVLPTRAPLGEVALVESMPGDLLQIRALVLGADGQRIPDDALTSLWIQCSSSEFCTGADLEGLPDCELLLDQGVFTTDARCVLGEGDGAFRYEVPPFGSIGTLFLSNVLLGAVAWEGRNPRDCLDVYRSGRGSFDRCAVVRHLIFYGPTWQAQAYAGTLGLPTQVPPDEIPAEVLEQAPNYVPEVIAVWAIGSRGAMAAAEEGPLQIKVSPGERVNLWLGFDVAAQDLQSVFLLGAGADGIPEFTSGPEFINRELYTTGALQEVPVVELGLDVPDVSFVVDPDAEPGRSWAIVVFRDHRGGTGFESVEVEVVGGS